MAEERATLGENGRLVIPVQFRRAMGLQIGESVTLRLDEHGLHILTQRQRIARAQAMLKKYVGPERSLADELIAERRLEAKREEEGR